MARAFIIHEGSCGDRGALYRSPGRRRVARASRHDDGRHRELADGPIGSEDRSGLIPLRPFAYQHNLSHMVRVRREIEQGCGQIPAGDVIRAVGEVLSTGLDSNAIRRRPVRQVGRSYDRPFESATCDQAFHSPKVGIRLTQEPTNQVDRNPRASALDRIDAHRDESLLAHGSHLLDQVPRDLADDGRRTTALRTDNRNDGVLSGNGPSDILRMAAVPRDHGPQTLDSREFCGAASERSHRVPTTNPFVEDEPSRSTRRSDDRDVHRDTPGFGPPARTSLWAGVPRRPRGSRRLPEGGLIERTSFPRSNRVFRSHHFETSRIRSSGSTCSSCRIHVWARKAARTFAFAGPFLGCRAAFMSASREAAGFEGALATGFDFGRFYEVRAHGSPWMSRTSASSRS